MIALNAGCFVASLLYVLVLFLLTLKSISPDSQVEIGRNEGLNTDSPGTSTHNE